MSNFKTYVIFMVTLFCTSFVYAQCNDRWCDEARAQLLAGAIIFGAGEYQLAAEPVLGKIYRRRSGQSSKWLNATLEEGISYAVLGVCDSDCTDIDIKIYDNNDNLVASDTSMDDKPMVKISPVWTGKFYIKAIIHECKASRCTYGVGLFEKPLMYSATAHCSITGATGISVGELTSENAVNAAVLDCIQHGGIAKCCANDTNIRKGKKYSAISYCAITKVTGFSYLNDTRQEAINSAIGSCVNRGGIFDCCKNNVKFLN